MILFNSILAQNISKYPGHFLVKVNNQITIETYSSEKSKRHLSRLPCLVSNVNFLTRSQEDLADKNLITNNLLRKLVNKFWQQTIFLSVPTELSEDYTSQLNSLNLLKNKVNHKKFLYEFSRSLKNGSIESFISEDLLNGKSFSSVKYIWRKGFNPQYFLNFKSLIFNPRRNSLQEIQKYAGNQPGLKNFPLFIVMNHLGQMVIAEQPEPLNINKSTTTELYNQSRSKPLSEAWFFVSSEDAEEYVQHVKKQYGIISNTNKLKVVTCSLETFYKLSSNSRYPIQFRLVPDLHEVGKLVTKHSAGKNILFDKRQNFGIDYFQGQPIYIIDNETNDYYYQIFQDKSKIKFKPVFTNYDTAMSLCHKLIKSKGYSKISKDPKFTIYNLEDFLEDRADNSRQSDLPVILIPSKHSYEFAKNGSLKKNHDIVYNNVHVYFSYLKLWTRKVWWSLTSRHL